MRTTCTFVLTVVIGLLLGCGEPPRQLSAPEPANPEVVRQEDQAVGAAEAAEAARQAKEAVKR
ncbi:MAG: hypothetical protein NZ899_13020 [Thermoguttaceae bacterium]|nr:hypothetical protein [Thermoguttaceae bacterium]MDW8079992.1 hypothetical protein [Thermoguttaceae bacterium]